uniref:Uncharacterized protein n=1 Tax=Kuenenia stuttgartiensis TaxID=174633 RepID=Q1Q6K4_KUEST|nr:unknown protein [Candidatus Kuenenia stuttgartiensis]
MLHNCCLPVRDRTHTGMFWICFEFYAMLFEFVSYFVFRISYFLFLACLVPAMPAYSRIKDIPFITF